MVHWSSCPYLETVMAYKGREISYSEWRRRRYDEWRRHREQRRIDAAARTVPMGDEEHIEKLAAAARGVVPGRRGRK